jgi:hypothetical protein
VKFYKTPNSVLTDQLAVWDKIMEKKSGENPMFKRVLESQRKFAERATKWQNDTQVDFKAGRRTTTSRRRPDSRNPAPPCGLDCRVVFFCAGESMKVQAFLYWVDSVSTWLGKAFAWMIIILMLYVCGEVIKRYALNNPSNWFFDISTMMYGVTFMMCGAYTLAQDAHVRGDFLYGNSSRAPRPPWISFSTSCSSFPGLRR